MRRILFRLRRRHTRAPVAAPAHVHLPLKMAPKNKKKGGKKPSDVRSPHTPQRPRTEPVAPDGAR